MIEIYQRMSIGTTNQLNSCYAYRRINKIELLEKLRSEEFIYKKLKFHSISNLCNLNPQEKTRSNMVSLSLSERSKMKKFRKYSCQDELNKEPKGLNIDNQVDRKKYLVDKIIQERLEARNRLVKFFRSFRERESLKQSRVISYILTQRQNSAEVIQKSFRMFLVRREIKQILYVKQNDYILFYRQEDKITGKKIQLKINKKYETILDFKYSRALDTYYLILKDLRVLKKRFKVNFIVDGKVIIDPRYKVDCEDDKFYNIIESYMLVKGKRVPRKVVHKAWEKVFEINGDSARSISDASVSEQPDIDRVLKKILHNTTSFKKTPREVKPVLRKVRSGIRKNVTFSDRDIIFQY
jgi:hypothetical protein